MNGFETESTPRAPRRYVFILMCSRTAIFVARLASLGINLANLTSGLKD